MSYNPASVQLCCRTGIPGFTRVTFSSSTFHAHRNPRQLSRASCLHRNRRRTVLAGFCHFVTRSCFIGARSSCSRANAADLHSLRTRSSFLDHDLCNIRHIHGQMRYFFIFVAWLSNRDSPSPPPSLPSVSVSSLSKDFLSQIKNSPPSLSLSVFSRLAGNKVIQVI